MRKMEIRKNELQITRKKIFEKMEATRIARAAVAFIFIFSCGIAS